MTPSIAPPGTSAGEAQELMAQAAELERTQRAEDVEGFVALFEEDAVWITGGDRRLFGREAIAAFTRKVLPGAFVTGSVRYDVVHIRFITTDVALTSVDQEYLTTDGQPLSPRQEGRPTYVWHRRDGRWRIASGQNTGVPSGDD
jgi:uncharacterized protein (TIGR02246 family)